MECYQLSLEFEQTHQQYITMEFGYTFDEYLEMAQKKQRFTVKDGNIEYIRSRDEKDHEWYGCGICGNRWFPESSSLEHHYTEAHKGAESFKFELIELRSLEIALPYLDLDSILKQLEQTLLKSDRNNNRTCYDQLLTDELPKQFSALTLSSKKEPAQDAVEKKEIRPVPEMNEAIRKAIKASQDGDKGASFKKIKKYLVHKYGMKEDKLDKHLRKKLEHYVEFKKLNRKFSKGRTVYMLPSTKLNRGEVKRIPKEETRRWRDHQLRLLVKSLKVH